MRTFLLFNLTLSLMLTAAHSPVFAQDAPPKAVPMKQVPTEGVFEIKVTAGDHESTYPHPSKALTIINRAVSRAKRAKEGEQPAFEAVLTLNDQVFTFSDPESAFEACRTLTNALRELPKMRMGLGDLGEIPEVKKEEQPAANASNPPMTPKSRAAAVAEVRRRINLALRKQMSGGSGRYGQPSRPRMPNPLTMRRTIQQEIEKARNEGLLPANTSGNNSGGGFAGGDPREAKKEAIVQTLGLVLGQADSVSKAGEKPEETKPEETNEEKPAEN